jgi:N-acetylglucosamine-6-phosphate deacetylase
MARSDISASDVYVKHGRFCFGISPDVNAETSVTRFHSGEDTFIPGYIDIQFNGGVRLNISIAQYKVVPYAGFGVDFSDPNTITEAAIRDVLHKLLSRGVTALCATLISSAPSTFALVVPMASFGWRCK